ncbi:MAG: tyrosine-type recombinase/integrase [Betaproteobacteria bacterium]|jgi:integrase|nr:tyrosine-type recombinase/integrase [Candidatus Dechloromonas phosphorivorans]
MSIDLKSKTSRLELAPRREPYWERISAGFHIGYRRLESGDGTWIARIRSDDGKQKYQALGTFDKKDDAETEARKWRDRLDQGVTKSDTTVTDACKDYVIRQKTEKGPASARDAEIRFKRLVYDKPIGKIPLSKLKTTDVRKWVNDQLATDDDDDDEDLRKSKDSTNRNLASFKAALNLALKDRLVATDAGWKTITPFRSVGRRREYMLKQTERTALLAACPLDLQPLVKGLLLTAARSGELAKSVVSDFDKKHGTMILAGKTGRRIVTLSTAARVFMAEQCIDKLPAAPIFSDSFGNAWKKDAWKKPFKAAVKKSKLPDNIVTYHLRHAAISELLLSGMQTSLVAMLAGTSTAMIDKHYGHLQHEQTRVMLDSVAMI